MCNWSNNGAEDSSAWCTPVSPLWLIHKKYGYCKDRENWVGGSLKEMADGKAAGKWAAFEHLDVVGEGWAGSRVSYLQLWLLSSGSAGDWEMLLWQIDMSSPETVMNSVAGGGQERAKRLCTPPTLLLASQQLPSAPISPGSSNPSNRHGLEEGQVLTSGLLTMVSRTGTWAAA